MHSYRFRVIEVLWIRLFQGLNYNVYQTILHVMQAS